MNKQVTLDEPTNEEIGIETRWTIDRVFGAILVAIGICMAVGFMAYASKADAQTVPGSLKLTWQLPTTGCTDGVTPCDNKPLTGSIALTGIEVYLSTSPIADTSTMAPTLTLGAGITTTTHTMQVANGSTIYARVKAVNADGKSPFSVQGSKLIQLPVKPGVPTDVTIELQIGAAP